LCTGFNHIIVSQPVDFIIIHARQPSIISLVCTPGKGKNGDRIRVVLKNMDGCIAAMCKRMRKRMRRVVFSDPSLCRAV